MGRHAAGWKLEWRGRTKRKIGYVRFSHGNRQHLISTGKRDPGEAAIEAGRLYARVVGGGVARATSTRALIVASLDALFAEWLASLSGLLDARTIETYETTYVGRHWLTHFSSVDEMIDPAARERYRSARLKMVSAKTVKKECWAQDKFLRWAKLQGVIADVPSRLEWDKRTLGERSGPQREVARELTATQVAAVLAALPEWFETGDRAKEKRPYPVRGRFVFMYETSLRPGTLSELVWGDWKGETLQIRPETDKVRFGRTVPLSDRAQAALIEVMIGAKARAVPTGDDDRIFGDHLYRKTLARAALAAGLDGVAPYDLRHARGTHLGDAGASLTGIAHLLGHKQVTTSARYIHSSTKAAARDLAKGAAFQVSEALLPNSSEASSYETPRKQGWPAGFEPVTSGATIQHGACDSADLGSLVADEERQESPHPANELGFMPRIGARAFDARRRAFYCPTEGRHFDAIRPARGGPVDCPSCGALCLELGTRAPSVAIYRTAPGVTT